MRHFSSTAVVLTLSLCSARATPIFAQNPTPPTQSVPLPANPAQQARSQPPQQLTIKDAEAIALKNNPQISIARLNALASREVSREVRSGFFPNSFVSLTAVDAPDNSRIAAGGLNNPIIFERAAVGTTLSQTITDFGRTSNLYSSSKLRVQAENQNLIATQEQIRLVADEAFYNVLQTRALLHVAEQTVASRQLFADRIQSLFNSKLKSSLDLSFANVEVAQAKLLLLDTQNNNDSALANLFEILGFPGPQNLDPVEETTEIVPPASDVDRLIADALQNRPELAALDFEYQAAEKFQRAERDLSLPTVSALGSVGSTPVRDEHLTNWFGAVGVNVNIPVFNGMLFTARAKEAELRSQAANQRLIDLRNRIARDVRTDWLNASNAYNRLSVTRQLQEQANLALDLAQTRYNLGLSSIVEFSQAELQKTQADITNAAARYQYRAAEASLRFSTAGH